MHDGTPWEQTDPAPLKGPRWECGCLPIEVGMEKGHPKLPCTGREQHRGTLECAWQESPGSSEHEYCLRVSKTSAKLSERQVEIARRSGTLDPGAYPVPSWVLLRPARRVHLQPVSQLAGARIRGPEKELTPRREWKTNQVERALSQLFRTRYKAFHSGQSTHPPYGSHVHWCRGMGDHCTKSGLR